MIALKRILVATDFSEPSEVAISYGRPHTLTPFARVEGVDITYPTPVNDAEQTALQITAEER
jgi:hypothetical protein